MDAGVYGEPYLTFRGKLRPSDDGRTLLSYEIQINDSYKDADGKTMFIRSGCHGQVFLKPDLPVAPSEGGKRSFTLTLSADKKKKQKRTHNNGLFSYCSSARDSGLANGETGAFATRSTELSNDTKGDRDID